MLLSKFDVRHSQRVLYLKAAARNGEFFNDQSSNADFLQAVSYRQLALVVKQYEIAAKV